MNIFSRIANWWRDIWVDDEAEDADGYPGDDCLMCSGEGGWLEFPDVHAMVWCICPACKGKRKVQ